jgi:hypothetical protein
MHLTCKGDYPDTLPVVSYNRSFRGTFFLREYLGSKGGGRCACIVDDADAAAAADAAAEEDHAEEAGGPPPAGPQGGGEKERFASRRRISPVEAEERAGMGASKNWKKSLLAVVGGGKQHVTLRKLLAQIGAEDDAVGGGNGGRAAQGSGAQNISIHPPVAPHPLRPPLLHQMLTTNHLPPALPPPLPGLSAFDPRMLSALALMGLWPMPGLVMAPAVPRATIPAAVARASGAYPGAASIVDPQRNDLLPALPTRDDAVKDAAGTVSEAVSLANGESGPKLSDVETVQLISRNSSFTGLLYLRDYLSGRKHSAGRALGPCIVETGPGGNPLTGTRLTPGEAEERAGLGSNKNWKKSFMWVCEGPCPHLSLPSLHSSHIDIFSGPTSQLDSKATYMALFSGVCTDLYLAHTTWSSCSHWSVTFFSLTLPDLRAIMIDGSVISLKQLFVRLGLAGDTEKQRQHFGSTSDGVRTRLAQI